MEKAIFCGGCFWCIEAVYKRIKGVDKIVSGYTGGFVKNPSYREICNGTTGHAEGVKIDYNPSIVSYQDLLEIFFAVHDPTTINRQGNDIGSQYRSAIFFTSDIQKRIATKFISDLDNSNIFENPIVTTVEKFQLFYNSEEEHHNYYDLNTNQPYCNYIISPKIKLIKRIFKDRLK